MRKHINSPDFELNRAIDRHMDRPDYEYDPDWRQWEPDPENMIGMSRKRIAASDAKWRQFEAAMLAYEDAPDFEAKQEAKIRRIGGRYGD